VLQKKEDYEIRTYSNNQTAFFTAAYVGTSDFNKAVKAGFDKNFKYISGDNEKQEKIPMTAPVTFTRDHATDGWIVGFFVPSTYKTKDEVPKPTDKSITIVEIPEGTKFAVATFGGFATKTDFNEELHKLSVRLQEDDVKVVHDELLLVWASYESPFTLFDRHNEVWLHVEASGNSTVASAEAALPVTMDVSLE
jgi:hypothetical protein